MANNMLEGVRTLEDGTRVCLLEWMGCSRPHYASRLCHTHYEMQRRSGILRPILKDISYPECRIAGCENVADNKTGSKLCATHQTRKWHGKDLEAPVRKQFSGYNEDRTRRVCRICSDDKPIDLFYMKNKSIGLDTRSTMCKECYKKDIAYYQGKRKTKADGTDPRRDKQG